MRKKIQKVTTKVPDPTKSIKVQIDSKTIVTVKSLSAFEQWLSRFSNAKIIQ
jgi:hypothetical protein